MKPNKIYLTAIALFLSIFVIASSTAAQGNTAKAGLASSVWLAQVDSGEYGESWNSAATHFKNTVKKEAWVQTLKSYRKPLGKTISRKIVSQKLTTELPAAPDGQYVLIDYESSFENKKQTMERVTAMLEKDGSWKVAGYFFK
ncbi:MAG: DUF4019 domain-containing protein [Deltaproteobacteria bacterium]|nr:DUF4019 domain-containing protein [Deltaproteobacteria bacterium]